MAYHIKEEADTEEEGMEVSEVIKVVDLVTEVTHHLIYHMAATTTIMMRIIIRMGMVRMGIMDGMNMVPPPTMVGMGMGLMMHIMNTTNLEIIIRPICHRTKKNR